MASRTFIDTQNSDTVPVTISAKSARLLFQGCTTDFIAEICHGACCHYKNLPEGTIVKVEEDQRGALVELGATFVNGIMQTVNRRCRFFDEGKYLCQLHTTGLKPRSCIQSPFTINKNDTLVLRNRYKLLPCYGAQGSKPAYKAFSASLTLLFGAVEATRIITHLSRVGSGNLVGFMLRDRYHFNKAVTGVWHAGTYNRAEFLVAQKREK